MSAQAWFTLLIVSIGSTLVACDSGDTVVALNVSFAASASGARNIAVSISQPGQGATDTTLSVPTKDSDAGLVLKDTRFVQRITLPASYTDAEATITVVAKDASGKDIDTATAMFNPRPNSATAAFVTVGKDADKMPTTPAGEADAGAEDTASTENAATAAAGAGAGAGAAGNAAAAGTAAAGNSAAAGTEAAAAGAAGK